MNEKEVRIGPAERNDLLRLSEIAFAAKAYWQYPAEWLEIWRPQLTISEADLSNGTVVKLTASGEVRGFYVLREDGGNFGWNIYGSTRRASGKGLDAHFSSTQWRRPAIRVLRECISSLTQMPKGFTLRWAR